MMRSRAGSIILQAESEFLQMQEAVQEDHRKMAELERRMLDERDVWQKARDEATAVITKTNELSQRIAVADGRYQALHQKRVKLDNHLKEHRAQEATIKTLSETAYERLNANRVSFVKGMDALCDELEFFVDQGRGQIRFSNDMDHEGQLQNGRTSSEEALLSNSVDSKLTDTRGSEVSASEVPKKKVADEVLEFIREGPIASPLFSEMEGLISSIGNKRCSTCGESFDVEGGPACEALQAALTQLQNDKAEASALGDDVCRAVSALACLDIPVERDHLLPDDGTNTGEHNTEQG
ncbi:unnamed protein product (mitochondrion) [Plasmodiophora brassicae]|uniref:Uncharacterized protein n=1 Tax=Plasmodiophora brassicae TaxID=37360 RepID=A0A0G4IVD8_PLABS|nr:hypothetical protein PBRA_001161 [Plasmodiophora brassicae]SPQ97265.1 unnamed protein product [Plasmodiophora brassicae]